MTLRPLLAFCAMLSLVGGGALPACAQNVQQQPLQGMTGTDGGPLDVSADNAVEWHQTERAYVARGHAHAQRGPNSIDSDVLTAFYREPAAGAATPAAAQKSQISQIVADGNVHIVTSGREVFGDRAVYDADRQVMVVTGAHIRLVAGNDTVTARDALEYYEQTNLAVARGDAAATRGTDRLRADVLVGRFAKGADGSTTMDRLDGTGQVVVTTATDVATSDQLMYSVPDQVAVLMGNVKITRGDNQIGGEAAEMNMKTKVNRVLPGNKNGGRVRVLLVPGSNDAGAASDKKTADKKAGKN